MEGAPDGRAVVGAKDGRRVGAPDGGTDGVAVAASRLVVRSPPGGVGQAVAAEGTIVSKDGDGDVRNVVDGAAAAGGASPSPVVVGTTMYTPKNKTDAKDKTKPTAPMHCTQAGAVTSQGGRIKGRLW